MNDPFPLLKQKYKIRLNTWWWGRYIYLENNKLLDETNQPFPKNELTQTLPKHCFWEIYQEDKHGNTKFNNSNLK